MDDKDRFDAYMELVKLTEQRHNARRPAEWRVTFGLWGLIVAAILSSKQLPLSLPEWGLLAALTFVLYGWWWLYPLWKANAKDKERQFYFREQAEIILKVPRPTSEDFAPISPRGFLGDWSMWFQLFVAGLLLAILIIVTWRSVAVGATIGLSL